MKNVESYMISDIDDINYMLKLEPQIKQYQDEIIKYCDYILEMFSYCYVDVSDKLIYIYHSNYGNHKIFLN